MTRSPIFAHAADQYRQMRAEFDVVLEAAYAAAEEGTHGKLLNAAGRAAPVDAYSLLMGQWTRVLKYGSPELVEWFEAHGRPSVAEFEREWFTVRQAPEPEPLVLGFDGTPPEILVSFPQDPHLTAQMRKDLIERFREVQGCYPVFMNYDHGEI